MRLPALVRCAAAATIAVVASAAATHRRLVTAPPLSAAEVVVSATLPGGPGSRACDVAAGRNDDAIAIASYAAGQNETGWGILLLEAGPNALINGYDGEDVAFAAGCAEAATTLQEMGAYWSNYAAAEYGAAGPSPALLAFMANQSSFVRAHVEAFRRRRDAGAPPAVNELDDTFWAGVSLQLASFDGLVYYATNLAPPSLAMSSADIYLLNSVGDLEDLNGLFPNAAQAANVARAARAGRPDAHRLSSVQRYSGAAGWDPIPVADKLTDCSAAVRVLPNLADVVAGHTTWRSYYAMLRIYKVTAHWVTTAAGVVSFASSPGLLHSKDDWYVTPHLIVQETTNSVFNATLFQLYITPQSVLTWQRVFTANMMATGGEQWADLFALYNSGTYNNQWMVTSYHSFTPGQAPRPDLLWVLEQIPGTTQAGDVTAVMMGQGGIWPSYNIPYFPAIYNASGYPAMAAKYGPSYTYANCSRALIFARNASDVVDQVTLRALLRYNDYQHDPLAGGDPILGAVSSRGDLRSPTPVAFGGIDTKVSALSQMGPYGQLTVLAESGPTHDQQAPFAWSHYPSFAGIVHDLVPLAFDFDTIAIAVDDGRGR